jgi:hypothetical protein
MSKDRLPETPPAEEPFISRWSRRKLAEEEALPATPAEPPRAEPPPALTDADMPPLESLDEESDYSGFLSPKVSEALRQQALSKLFRSTCFNVCDGLDDYAEDFSSFEKLGDLITSDLRFRLQQEAQRAARRAEALAEEETPSQSHPSAAQGESGGDGGTAAALACDSLPAGDDNPEQNT